MTTFTNRAESDRIWGNTGSVPKTSDAMFRIYDDSGRTNLGITEGVLNKHILLVGSTGTGKTNLINHLVGNIKSRMTPNDVMIIFDTKGDFEKMFFRSNDVIIGNSGQYISKSESWNIFNDILAGGTSFDEYDQNAREVATSFFASELRETGRNSFFPQAAADLFGSVLSSMIKDRNMEGQRLDNRHLRDFMHSADTGKILKQLSNGARYGISRFYLGDGGNEQGLGVMATMENTVCTILQGVFAHRGDFSIRNFVRRKGGRTLFIEYDMAVGSVLTPVYRLLIDMALKEALSRSENSGNIYLVLDEFKLLPDLQHIDDAVNYGRSLGVKVIAGIQSVSQLYANYGKDRGNSIAAGFSSLVAFRCNDSQTREFVTGRFGTRKVEETTYSASGQTLHADSREDDIVHDWDITSLKPLEAIVGLAFEDPFRFRFSIYGGGHNQK